jgi:8-oxo-dGTP diphosphatase
MDDKVKDIYGNKLRVRVCGLYCEGGRLLMINHAGITPTDFWAPPGGGVEFGQSTRETLRREFREETGLIVDPGTFLFGCEYLKDPIHSVELFFEVSKSGGELKKGYDPEIQIIRDVSFIDFQDIKGRAAETVHGIFREVTTMDELFSLRGFYRI